MIDPEVFLRHAKAVIRKNDSMEAYGMPTDNFDLLMRGKSNKQIMVESSPEIVALYLCLAAAIAADPANR